MTFLKNDTLGYQIPLDNLVDWLIASTVSEFYSQLRVISDVINNVIKLLSVSLSSIPPLIFIVIVVGVLIWRRKGLWVVTSVAGMLLLLLNQGLWQVTMFTLAIVLASVFFSLIIALPIGILAGHYTVLYAVLRPILDFMQTVPVYVYLIPAVMLFGLGTVPGVIATIVFSLPPPLRMAYLGIREIPQGRIEAGKAFGASRWQLLCEVELPSAKPSIMMGINQCLMMAVSMVTLAAMIGAGGLGQNVLYALNTIDIGAGFVAGLAIVILAVFLDRLVTVD
jgi:glycine betaine/proline transport system permease protein